MKLGVVAVALGVALLAGCAPSVKLEPSTPTAAVTAEPTPTADPEPDLSDPANWIIGFDSVGPLSIGQPIDDARAAAVGYVESDGVPGCPVAFLHRSGYPSLALVHWPDDVVTSIFVSNHPELSGSASEDLFVSSPKTSAGIGIGSTREDLLAAHPDASVTIDEGYFAVYVITGSTGAIVVTVSEGIVNSIKTDPAGTFAYELC